MSYKIEFERRLSRLYRAIVLYKEEGLDYDLFPALFSIFSYLWTSRNAVKM